MSLFQKYILFISVIAFGYGQSATENKTYTKVSDIRRLSHSEAEKNNDVELTGVITYSFKSIDIGFIQDGTAGIFYLLNDSLKPEFGDLVKITAKTGPGEFAPVLTDSKIEVLGKGKLPAISKNAIDNIFNGHEDSQWIGVNGLIKSVRYDEHLESFQFTLDFSGRSMDAYVICDEKDKIPYDMLGTIVHIEGVCGADFNQDRQLLGIRLFVQSMEQIKIIRPELVNPFKKEPLPVNQILQYSTTFDRNQRIRIQGTVIYQGDRKIYIQDSTGSITVYTNLDYNFETGDILDIVGFAEAGEFSPEIKSGLCKKIGRGEPQKPVRIDSLTSLTNISEASLISLDAALIKIIHQKSNSILYLEKDSTQFQALFENGQYAVALEEYQLGSIINVSGIAHLKSNPTRQQKLDTGVKIPQSVIVILRNPNDIYLVDQSPWLTIQKAVGLLAGLSILILLSFGWVYQLKRKVSQRTQQLKKSNQDLVSSQKEKDVILQNVEEGLFLLDDKLIIQSEYSSALLHIMQIKSPAGKSFSDFLSSYLKKDTIKTIVDYIELILEKNIDAQLINDLNPIRRLAFYFKNEDGILDIKYLSFEFKQVIIKQKNKGLIVSVIDETEEYKLAEKLKKSEEKSKKQLEWLKSVINLDPKILNEFLTTSSSEINTIEKRLIPENAHDTLALEHVARSLHLLKGNANLLDLTFFAQQVHTLEDITLSVKQNKNSSDRDYNRLVSGNQDLKNDLKELSSLINKLALFSSQSSTKNNLRDKTILDFMKKMIARLASDLKKKVNLDTSGFKSEIIPPQYLLVLKNILIQLIRNSMSHGIEKPQERKKSKKPEAGQIQISSSVEENNFVVHFRDDGRGLQLHKLKEKALQNGTWQEKEINAWDRDTLADIIFESGISSSDNTDIIAGRGIGMDLIKNQLIKHKGQISVDFAEGRFCEFTVTLPLINEN